MWLITLLWAENSEAGRFLKAAEKHLKYFEILAIYMFVLYEFIANTAL